VELRFVPPDLRRLDLLVSEIIAVPIAIGDRPPQGSAGLLDYRLGGRISEVIASGAITGSLGEKLFLSGRPRLPYDKIFLYGVGDNSSFNPQTFARIVELLLNTMSELGAKRAVVELPGRALDLISPEIAANVLLQQAGDRPEFDTWTLIDTPAAQRAVNQRVKNDRANQWQ